MSLNVRLVLQAIATERMLLQDSSAGKCVNKMRAVFMLRRSLGTGSTFGNASAIQKTVRCDILELPVSDMSVACSQSWHSLLVIGNKCPRLLNTGILAQLSLTGTMMAITSAT